MLIIKMTFYLRNIQDELEKHLKVKHITVLTGMRRTGKTTLVKKLLEGVKSKNKLYLDLERLDVRDLFKEKNYDLILQNLEAKGLDLGKKMYLAIDEIQLVKNIPSVLKYFYDNYEIKLIVTGSSSYYLKNLFSESLAGRKKIFELFPLNFGEFLRFKEVQQLSDSLFINKKFNSLIFHELKTYYQEYLNFGGFPEVVLTKKESVKKDILHDVLSSYINKDVKSLADFKNISNLENLIKMLALRIGTKLDNSKIARLAGISRITLLNYLDFLEKTYFISRLPAYSKNPDREIVKAKKIYFIDNGFLKILADTSEGNKFENAVFSQLRHFGKLAYYALKNGQEIDFILDQKIGFEVKISPTQNDLNRLSRLSKNINLEKVRLIGKKEVLNFTDYIWGGEIR